MTVEEFEKKYKALQKEGDEIYSQINPLLKRLKSFSKKCVKLGNVADGDNGLYEKVYVICKAIDTGKEFVGEKEVTRGWNPSIRMRLGDMEWLSNNLRGFTNCLYNLKHTPFRKAHRVNKHDK